MVGSLRPLLRNSDNTTLGYEYQWLYPSGYFRREFQTPDEFNQFRKEMPKKIQEIASYAINQSILNKPNQFHYYVINLNARQIKNQFLIDKNQPKVRLNFAPHTYMWPSARFGEEKKVNIYAAIFTSQKGDFINSSFKGIEECNDWGRISINPVNFFVKSNQMEVHLHQSDEHNMAISPNNGAFLLNLGFPIVNFDLVMCTMGNEQNISVFK